MQTLRYKSRGAAVTVLEEMLVRLGYSVYVSEYFGRDTEAAILDFQQKNNLVIDGICGLKTWAVLLNHDQRLLENTDKLLAEDDLIEFGQRHDLELPLVKAVNEVESAGKGFLLDGRPKILFEGHVFWNQLVKRTVNPTDFVNDYRKNVLFPSATKTYYQGGSLEYNRLEKAAGISDLQAFHDAAYCSASWGAFQIMGYHFQALGYSSVDDFVSRMYEHEREHLKAFGRFLAVNNLLIPLKNKDWNTFARGYNGSGYAKAGYHTKLARAYQKYTEN
jgi:hypothetical protein